MAIFRILRQDTNKHTGTQKENELRQNSGNACHHSVQNISSSHLASENINSKTNITSEFPLYLASVHSSLTAKENLYPLGHPVTIAVFWDTIKWALYIMCSLCTGVKLGQSH